MSNRERESSDNPLKKQICVVTGSRAEYGLLRPLIARIAQDGETDLRLLVTGSHLSASFGYTSDEIENDGYKIDAKIEMILSSDTATGMAKSTGLGMISFADYFSARRPDILVVLGDRFEAFAAASAAAMMRIPIAHICGGDVSEGAADEFMRHSITKMSALHFPSNEDSAERIIQLGESPDRVFNYGALHVECIKNAKLLTREELSADLGMDLSRPYILATYHPATLGNTTAPQPPAALSLPPPASTPAPVAELQILLDALAQFPDMQIIFTKANADSGGRAINELLDNFCGGNNNRNSNFHVYASLGSIRYLSAMRFAEAVVGNSSSGLYETPIFGIPAVNIGDRQKGRLCPENVINCGPIFVDIVISVKKAISNEFKQYAKQVRNPYGEGDTSRLILERIKKYLRSEGRNGEHSNGNTATAKSFYRITRRRESYES